MTPSQRFDTARFVAAALLIASTSAAAPAFERVSETPCRALALDRAPYVAALGDDSVTVVDKRGQHEEPLPDALRGPHVDLGVFFGRDYRVRVAGTAHTPAGDEVRYFRSLPGGLRSALDELGPLGGRGTPGLLALLGTADPEIVCRPGQSCLIKSNRGWAKASAPPGIERVGLSLGSGWAVAGTQFFHLKKDWQPLPAPGPWRKADDAFVRGEEVCVVERSVSKLHHYDGTAWHSATAPVTGPRSLWGSEDALWIGGEGGAAYLERDRFQRVDGVGRVAQVRGRSAEDVWLCTDTGLYRSR